VKSRFLILISLVLFIILTNIYGCATPGAVKYDPKSEIGMNKALGKGVTVAILRFVDNRGMKNDQEKLIGTIYGGFKNPLKRIYSDKEVYFELMDVMEIFFGANGYSVRKYPTIVNASEINEEDIVISGKINKFWSEGYSKIGAIVDIDVLIFDNKKKEFVWTGKIEKFQKKGMSAGIFTSTNRLVSLLNGTLSDAMQNAWLNQGMLKALKQHKKQN